MDDRIEKFFASELDNFIPDWIEVFSEALQSGAIRFKDDASKFRFIQFFYNHMKRTPDFIDPIVEKVSQDVLHEGLAEMFEEEHRSPTDEEIEMLNNESWRKRLISNTRVTNISQQSEKIMNALASLRIIVATPSRKSKKFIVASNPVVRFENYPKQRLGADGVELWTTLTPKIAVGFAVWNKPSAVIVLDDSAVRKINHTLTKNSSVIAGQSEKLLCSLAHSAW